MSARIVTSWEDSIDRHRRERADQRRREAEQRRALTNLAELAKASEDLSAALDQLEAWIAKP